ncbi:MAG TPA: hypothetical protein ENJ49_00280 [Candidatus Moranbacteria bacterium]|nr:hypothetical protein [Candidatus Moranbacteria bacterium]
MSKNKNETVEKIIAELGLDKLPKDRQDDILAKIGELILKKIFVETIDKLSDADRREFEKMLERGESAENIESFLEEKIDNYAKIVEDIVVEIKNDISPFAKENE